MLPSSCRYAYCKITITYCVLNNKCLKNKTITHMYIYIHIYRTTGGPSRVDAADNGHPRSVGASGDSDPAPDSRPSPPEPSKVLLVHGLDRVPVNCDRVFNLFCLYGNVMTVKILRDDKVLVEMEDAESARRCVSNLHMLRLDDEVTMKVK